MNYRKLVNHYTLLVSALCMATTNVNAAPGIVSDTPLFLLNSAKPNIFFVLDDSRSMDEELSTNKNEAQNNLGYVFSLTATYTDTSSNSSTATINNYKYVFDDTMSANTDNNNNAVVPRQDMIDDFNGRSPSIGTLSGQITTKAWKAFSYGYNKLYYNPDIDYAPWPGKTNATTTAAPKYPGSASTVDLTQEQGFTANIPAYGNYTMSNYYPAKFWYWDDANSNGVVDDGEGIEVAISNGLAGQPAATPQCLTGATPTVATPCLKRAYADEMQNFANWFVYYRKRDYTAKAALGLTIDSPFAQSTRMGMATINDNSSEQQMQPMYDTSLGTPDQYQTSLLSTLYSTSAYTTSTPLHQALNKAGRYYSCENNGTFFSNYNCPIQGMGSSNSIAASPSAGVAGECQQNFTVLLTDGEYNTSMTVTDYDANDTPAANDFDGQPYADGIANRLADLGMQYYKGDLSANLPDNVPTICGGDENPAQHMVTYTMTFGINGNLKWTDMPDRPAATAACGGPPATLPTTPAWPTGTSNDDKVDDVLHAAYNGRGKYLSASSPEELVNGLEDVLQDIASRKGAAAAVGISSTKNAVGTQVYFSRFNSGRWSGELDAYGLNADGSLNLATPLWGSGTYTGAHGQLNAISNASIMTARKIITYNPTKDATNGFGRPFDWAQLTGAQQNDLMTNSTGTLEASNVTALERLRYIRGDHRCEKNTTETGCTLAVKPFRDRLTATGTPAPNRLGDIINSSPVYVGASIGSYPETGAFPSGTNAYSAFKSSISSRTPVVYVGSNDGMLHAFNANNGTELFAYIPGGVYSTGSTAGLHKLSETNGHISYVDLTPTIADAYTATPTNATKAWRTVLVGGLRNGGNTIFALDITNPATITDESTASQKVMWEFTDADMGKSFSKPIIVPIKTSNTGPNGTIEWFAVFGNGYNSATGKAVLYLVRLSGPTGGTATNPTWTLGTDYFKFTTSVGDTLNVNGLSSPAVIDNDGNKVYDRAYAGDVQGNLWVFNMDWNSPSSSAVATPLFTATNALGEVQPITVKPTAIRNTQATSSATNAPNVLLLFGTGQYLASGDQSNTSRQSFWGIWDAGEVGLTRTGATYPLVKQDFIASLPAGIRAIDPANAVDYNGGDYGWYLDLPEDTVTANGERVIADASVIGDTLLFLTITPDTLPCSAGGNTWLMALNPFNGHSPGINTLDVNGNGIIGDAGDLNAIVTAANSTISGMQLSGLILDIQFISGANTAGGGGTPPCSSGFHTQGIGTTSAGTTTNPNLCVGGSDSKTGRYSWRQLRFE